MEQTQAHPPHVPLIDLTPVQSSMIRAMGYHPTTSTMAVQFSSGSTYYYHQVSPDKWAEAEAAESKGKWWLAAGIKEHPELFPCLKISGPDGANVRKPKAAPADGGVF